MEKNPDSSPFSIIVRDTVQFSGCSTTESVLILTILQQHQHAGIHFLFHDLKTQLLKTPRKRSNSVTEKINVGRYSDLFAHAQIGVLFGLAPSIELSAKHRECIVHFHFASSFQSTLLVPSLCAFLSLNAMSVLDLTMDSSSDDTDSPSTRNVASMSILV